MPFKTKIILTIVGVVAAIVVVAAILVVVQRPAPEVRVPTAQSESEGRVAVAARIDELVGAILAGADRARCHEAGTPEAVDRCFLVVALAESDMTVCDEVRDEGLKTGCRENLAATVVANGGDVLMCSTLQDTEFRRACILAALEAGASPSFCGNFSGEDQSFCGDYLQLRRAGSGEVGACDSITDEALREECILAQGRGAGSAEPLPPPPTPSDTDRDGLTDEEEEALGTNPLNPDTDGDGFSDGTEVRNGYNPKGPGRL